MPYTGVDFSNLLDLKTDMAYTGYFDITQRTAIVREATTKAVEIKVATNDRIQVQDDIFGIYKSNQVFTPSSNTIDLIPAGSGISDYHHIMNMRAKFVESLSPNYITEATNTTPIRISLYKNSNLRTGDAVVIAGVTTNTNANGTRYVKRIKNNLYQLYSDINLANPVAGNGAYTGVVGQISRVLYNVAFNLKSARKFSFLNEATTQNPYYEIADTVLKISPLTIPCTEATIDYVSTPVYIDLSDSNTDLLETYSQRFLDFIADNSARLMGMYLYSLQLSNQEQSELSNQP